MGGNLISQREINAPHACFVPVKALPFLGLIPEIAKQFQGTTYYQYQGAKQWGATRFSEKNWCRFQHKKGSA